MTLANVLPLDTGHYRIEKGIAVPKPKDSHRVYPLMDMVVGDSFLVPCKADDNQAVARRLSNRVSHFRKRHGLAYQFAMRVAPGGVRVWRTK